MVRYQQGTLLIDFSSASSQRVVWRGSGRARVSDTPAPEDQMRSNVYTAVTTILGAFPPERSGMGMAP